MKAPQHDRADELENDRELIGDAATAVRDFANEEQGSGAGEASATFSLPNVEQGK